MEKSLSQQRRGVDMHCFRGLSLFIQVFYHSTKRQWSELVIDGMWPLDYMFPLTFSLWNEVALKCYFAVPLSLPTFKSKHFFFILNGPLLPKNDSEDVYNFYTFLDSFVRDSAWLTETPSSLHDKKKPEKRFLFPMVLKKIIYIYTVFGILCVRKTLE